jgi:hypothetical protein
MPMSGFDADGVFQPTQIRAIEPKDDLILRLILRDGVRNCRALGAGSGLNVDEKSLREPAAGGQRAPGADGIGPGALHA